METEPWLLGVPTIRPPSALHPAFRARIGAWLCPKEKAFVSETSSKDSGSLCPLRGTHCGRCELKFPESGRGGRARAHAVQEAGCSGLHTAQPRAHWGLETGVRGGSRPEVSCACLRPSEFPLSGSESTSVWESCDNPFFSGPCLRLPPPRPPPPTGDPLSSTSPASLPDRQVTWCSLLCAVEARAGGAGASGRLAGCPGRVPGC